MSLTNISTSDPAFVHAVQKVLEVLGTLAFAVSGIRHAAAKHLDWFGGYVCGFAVAVGGGTLRDVMLGTTPFWMTSPIYVICTFAALGFVVCFGRHIRWIDNAWFVFDTLGLALFVIAGIQKTVAFEHPYWVAIIMGSMTGAAGGVIRDVLLNNVPVIFHKEIYATACVAGGFLYWVLIRLDAGIPITTTATFFFVCAIRLLAVRYHISLPSLKQKE